MFIKRKPGPRSLLMTAPARGQSCRRCPPGLLTQPYHSPLCFPSGFYSVQVLLFGAIPAIDKRTLTSVLRVMGMDHQAHFQTYHRALNRAAWSPLAASRILLRLLVRAFAPHEPLIFGLDDTIERRWGDRIAACGIYHGPVRSSRSHFVKVSGLRWLCMMLLVPIPWAARVCTLWAKEQHYYLLHVLPYTPADRFEEGKEDPAFRTEPQLALTLIESALAAGVAFRAVVADAFYGDHIGLARILTQRGLPYVLSHSGQKSRG